MNRFKDKYISIMGDSISTYEGYIPRGFETYYYHRDFNTTGIYGYRDTWWGQTLSSLGARLLINNSWSGSTVSKAAFCKEESYACSRARCGGLSDGDNMPDHIIIYIGTNDRGYGVALSDGGSGDISVFENAYRVMLERIKNNYPASELWCCTFPITYFKSEPGFVFPLEKSKRYSKVIRDTAKNMGCHLIDLEKRVSECETLDGLHANYTGMTSIALAVTAAMLEETE